MGSDNTARERSISRCEEMEDAHLIEQFLLFTSFDKHCCDNAFQKYQEIFAYETSTRTVVDHHDFHPVNAFIFPEEKTHTADSPWCPGPCCATLGDVACKTWYHVVIAI